MDEIKLVINVFIPLLIIMDPFGNLPFFLLFTEHNTPAEQTRMASTASLATFLILVFFAYTGDFILHYFEISLPAFQIAGGLIFFLYSLQMLRLIPSGMKTSLEEEQEGVKRANPALVPLATPMLAGPGAITAVLAWKQRPDDPVMIPILVAVIAAACLIVFTVFYFGKGISRILGVSGIRVITRLMGLLLAVIAVQFIINGFKQIM